MAESLRTPMDWNAYLDWEAAQKLRYEFVGGQVYALGVGTLAHDVIECNVHTELARQLRGTQCRRAGRTSKCRRAKITAGTLMP